MNNTNEDQNTINTNTETTENNSIIPKQKNEAISPPEIPPTDTTVIVTNTDNKPETTTSSYSPVTGQSQTVTTSRFNPIKSTINPTVPTPVLTENKQYITESKTESKHDDTLIQQQLLNQYAFYTPQTQNNALNTTNNNVTTATLTSPLGIYNTLSGGIGGGIYINNNAAQQYLLYNQLAAQATASYNNINNINNISNISNISNIQNTALLNPLLRAQLMAQRAAQLQTLSTDSQKWVLFVFHLPEDMDDNGLLLLFSPFGATKAIVMRHKITDCSRGFGFVHFRTKNDAQIAIDMMNGYQIGHKRLRVSFKKSKE